MKIRYKLGFYFGLIILGLMIVFQWLPITAIADTEPETTIYQTFTFSAESAATRSFKILNNAKYANISGNYFLGIIQSTDQYHCDAPAYFKIIDSTANVTIVDSTIPVLSPNYFDFQAVAGHAYSIYAYGGSVSRGSGHGQGSGGHDWGRTSTTITYRQILETVY